MKYSVAQAIVDLYSQSGDEEVRLTSYSGRGMFGSETYAVVIPEEESQGGVIEALTEAIDNGTTEHTPFIPESVTVDIAERQPVKVTACINELSNARSDSLGYSKVYY